MDLISRQALCEYALNQKDKSVTPNDIMRFPSVQPEMDEWCETCKEYDSEKHCCPRWNRVIREAVKQTEIIRCRDCKYNYGLMHGGEFNPDDIVCTFFDTDGMQYCDFCSYAERRTDEAD